MGMSYNPFSLEGKTILITGASSGIGRETAIVCSKLGAKLIITGRNEERLKLSKCLLLIVMAFPYSRIIFSCKRS